MLNIVFLVLLSIWFAAINAIQLTLKLSDYETRIIDLYSLYVFIGLLILFNAFIGYYIIRSNLKMRELRKEDSEFKEKVAAIKGYSVMEYGY